MKRRGVALPYTLLISMLLISFVAALLLRVTQSLRFTTFDESYVRARMLADGGARLAVTLMRDFNDKWYAGKLPVVARTSGPSAPRRSSAAVLSSTCTSKPSWVEIHFPPTAPTEWWCATRAPKTARRGPPSA